MTDTTQPPAETLAISRIKAMATTLRNSVITFGGVTQKSLHTRAADALDDYHAALTRPAGGDAIPAGERVRKAWAIVLREFAHVFGDIDGGYYPEVHEMRDALAALALPAPVVEGWQPIETAPYGTEVIVRAGQMTFRAELVRDGAMTTMEDACDQWAATREGEHPPCWSGGLCWEVNEDENTSLQPDAWMHVPAALSEGRSHG